MRSAKILIVDDSPTIRAQLADLLEEDGHKVLAVETGVQALSAVHVMRPDLVVLDINMPELDGIEVLARWRREFGHRGPSVLMITGAENVGRLAESLEAGALDFLVKPLSEGVTRLRVRAALRTRELMLELAEHRASREVAAIGV